MGSICKYCKMPIDRDPEGDWRIVGTLATLFCSRDRTNSHYYQMHAPSREEGPE